MDKKRERAAELAAAKEEADAAAAAAAQAILDGDAKPVESSAPVPYAATFSPSSSGFLRRN